MHPQSRNLFLANATNRHSKSLMDTPVRTFVFFVFPNIHRRYFCRASPRLALLPSLGLSCRGPNGCIGLRNFRIPTPSPSYQFIGGLSYEPLRFFLHDGMPPTYWQVPRCRDGPMCVNGELAVSQPIQLPTVCVGPRPPESEKVTITVVSNQQLEDHLCVGELLGISGTVSCNSSLFRTLAHLPKHGHTCKPWFRRKENVCTGYEDFETEPSRRDWGSSTSLSVTLSYMVS
jgi:hypothetical protein